MAWTALVGVCRSRAREEFMAQRRGQQRERTAKRREAKLVHMRRMSRCMMQSSELAKAYPQHAQACKTLM